jgi:hypothetical protein
MDSLPTGTTQSWFFVSAVALIPVILLLFVDAIGRVRRHKVVAHARGRPAEMRD